MREARASRAWTMVIVAAFLAGITVFSGASAHGQDESTTTTQLDIPQEESPQGESTTTTQLDIPEESTTTTQLDIPEAATTGAPASAPTRVDAGFGGTASDSDVPATAAAAAAVFAVIVAAAAIRMRRAGSH